MLETKTQAIIEDYLAFIKVKEFPCIAAKAALAKRQVKCMVADHMECPKDDLTILNFLYAFVNDYRNSKDFYHSAAIIFAEPSFIPAEIFDKLLWQRLQALADMDAENYSYDSRVSADPSSQNFSFSIKEEAFYVIGLHPESSRAARQFKYPTVVFNPHDQFEKLKETTKYEIMKQTVRKRDIQYSGSVNPMLKDFGEFSEAFQYSGQQYEETWQCPLKIKHATSKHNSTT